MDKKLFNIIKECGDYKRLMSELDTIKGKCYCLTNNDKYYRDCFLEVFLCGVYCKEKDAPCNNCNSCRQVQNLNKVDVCYFGEESGQVKKQSIEELLDSALTKPYEEKTKFIIIKNGDGLSDICQNMLLKTIEELPEFVTIFLLFSDTQKILPTIKSRSVNIALETLGARAIIQMLGSSERSISIVRCTDGNIGKSLSFEKDKEFDICYKFALKLFYNYERIEDYIKYNTYLQKNKDKLDFVLYVLKGVFYSALCGDVQTYYPKTKLAGLVDLVAKLEIDLAKKQNKMMIIDKLLIGILEVKWGNAL